MKKVCEWLVVASVESPTSPTHTPTQRVDAATGLSLVIFNFSFAQAGLSAFDIFRFVIHDAFRLAASYRPAAYTVGFFLH